MDTGWFRCDFRPTPERFPYAFAAIVHNLQASTCKPQSSPARPPTRPRTIAVRSYKSAPQVTQGPGHAPKIAERTGDQI